MMTHMEIYDYVQTVVKDDAGPARAVEQFPVVCDPETRRLLDATAIYFRNDARIPSQPRTGTLDDAS